MFAYLVILKRLSVLLVAYLLAESSSLLIFVRISRESIIPLDDLLGESVICVHPLDQQQAFHELRVILVDNE